MPAFGKVGKGLGMGLPPSDEEPLDDMPAEEDPMAEEEGGSDVPPDFEAAYNDYLDSPSASSMYAMIESCKAGGEKSSPGLALILGGKGKGR